MLEAGYALCELSPTGKPRGGTILTSKELTLLVCYGQFIPAPGRRINARARGQVYACSVLAFARVRAFVVGFELRFK